MRTGAGCRNTRRPRHQHRPCGSYGYASLWVVPRCAFPASFARAPKSSSAPAATVVAELMTPARGNPRADVQRAARAGNRCACQEGLLSCVALGRREAGAFPPPCSSSSRLPVAPACPSLCVPVSLHARLSACPSLCVPVSLHARRLCMPVSLHARLAACSMPWPWSPSSARGNRLITAPRARHGWLQQRGWQRREQARQRWPRQPEQRAAASRVATQ
jgi:hypothetical protein